VKEWNEAQRLELIVEVVRYCQRVKQLGMPSSCYAKALREPVYFLWERRRGGSKYKLARYRSVGVVGLKSGHGQLVYDHAIPFNCLLSELINLGDATPEAVRSVLEKYETCVVITKSDDDRLNASGLQAKMPDGWDHTDTLARYKAVGIELVDNRQAQSADGISSNSAHS
jgi:hypothetical protein